jgi:hypothetical protein
VSILPWDDAMHTDPDRDLAAALAAGSETSRVIAVADTKAGLVLAVQGVVLAGLVSSLRSHPPAGGDRSGAAVVLVLTAVTVLLLLAALWPRTTAPAASWFAFPALRLAPHAPPPARPPVTELADQAWHQAAALADVARRKFRWFRVASVIAGVDVAAFAAWTLLGPGA